MPNSAQGWNKVFVDASKPYWDGMLRFAVSLCHSKTEAEDILQNSLIKALKAFPSFVETQLGVTGTEEAGEALAKPHIAAHLRNWLYKITRNTFLDAHDKLYRRSFEADDEVLSTLADPRHLSSDAGFTPHDTPFSGDGAPSEADVKRQQADFYRAALDDTWKARLAELSDKQRSILFLAAEDYSYKEISNILNIPIGTVMSNLSRTLQKLRKSEKPTVGE